jgi:Holliday junction resolvase RusA-like endonuclease
MLARSPAAPRTIAFTIPGEAVPFARAGGGKTVARFTPAKQRSAMGQVKFYCQRAMQGAPPIEGPIELSISCVYLRPKSKQKAKWKTSRPDADNCSKLLKDALNKVAWRDDAQVVSLHVWKQYGDVAKVVVRIVELPE